MKEKKEIKLQEIADRHLKNMMLKFKFCPVIRCHGDKSDHKCLEREIGGLHYGHIFP